MSAQAVRRAFDVTLYPLRQLMTPFHDSSENFYGDVGQVKVAVRQDSTLAECVRLQQLARQVSHHDQLFSSSWLCYSKDFLASKDLGPTVLQQLPFSRSLVPCRKLGVTRDRQDKRQTDTFYSPFSRTAWVSQCQKKSAREDNRGRRADNPAGYHPIWTNQRPTSIFPPIFIPDTLSAATLPIYTGLGQAPNMLACIPSGLVPGGLIWRTDTQRLTGIHA